MLEHARRRFNTVCIAVLLTTLLPATGHNQVLAGRDPQQVSLSVRIVLGTEDFKRQLQSTDGTTVPADEPALQALLEQAVRNGEVELLDQSRSLTTERQALEVATDLQVLFEQTDRGSELIKTVRVELAMTPQVPSAKNVALAVKLTTKLFTPVTAGTTAVLTSDSRSLRSSSLIPEGHTLLLGGMIANTDLLQPAKKQGKRRELLALITPQVN